LSPDRKWIAFAGDNSLDLFDIEKREVIASQKTPRTLQGPAVAFSPSGRKIGCIAHDRILVWDTASGKLERDFAVTGLAIHGGIAFPDENFILANNQYLIELSRQIKLWHYQGDQRACTVGGTTFMAIAGDQGSGLLLAAKLPHSEAAALLKKALEQPDLFVFRQGTPVKLDVSGIPGSAKKKQVAEALTKKLKAMNCPIQDSAEIQVVATVEGPKEREISYMHLGTYQVKEYFARLNIVHQGNTLWTASRTNVPGFPPFGFNRGENIESVLQEASRRPPYEFFDTLVLPELLQKYSENADAGGGQTLGFSRVTVQGLR
jgi:hypothetical protein